MSNSHSALYDDAFNGYELTIHLDRGPHRTLGIYKAGRALLRSTITTGPGTMMITSNAGTYVLACQEEDIMDPERITPTPHWCAKTLATDANYGHQRFSTEKFRQEITEDYMARLLEYPVHTHGTIGGLINERLLWCGIETEAEALAAMRDFDHRGFDYAGRDFVFTEPTPHAAKANR
jgi:hypothetical protein